MNAIKTLIVRSLDICKYISGKTPTTLSGPLFVGYPLNDVLMNSTTSKIK